MDTVALEAGRKRGSIKRSRYAALVEAIEFAAQEVGDKKFFHRHSKLKKLKIKLNQWKVIMSS